MTEIRLQFGKKSGEIEDGQVFLIGKGKQCDIKLASDTVSIEHCNVSRNGDKLTITDLESKKGTFINGEKMKKGSSAPLNNEDKVHVSPNAGFVVIFKYDEIGFADEENPETT